MNKQLKRKISKNILSIIKTGFFSLFAGLMSLPVYAQQFEIQKAISFADIHRDTCKNAKSLPLYQGNGRIV
jgi:hypothetical protein